LFSHVDPVKNDLCADQRGEKVDNDSQAEGYRKPLDRPSAELEENNSRNQGSHMGVKDREKCFIVPRIDSRPDRFALAQFFPDALEHQHVAVHGHPDGQDNPGDAREREGGPNRDQGASR
jgi:hypothetical protein